MAINVDKVYKQVLAIMNKEGRGYLPAPEFNVLAHKAQMDIFDNTFHDYKMALLKPGNQSKFADELDMIREKISEFRSSNQTLTKSGDGTEGNISGNTHWLENIYNEQANSVRTVTMTLDGGSTVNNNGTTRIILRAYYSGSGAKAAGEGDYELVLDNDGNPNTPYQASLHFVAVGPTDTAAQVATTVKNYLNDRSPYHSATSSGADLTVTYKQNAALINGSESFGNWGGSMAATVNAAVETSAVASTVYYEEIDKQDWLYITSGGAKLKPTVERPVFYRIDKTTVGLYPAVTDSIKHDYISRPSSPKWAGTYNNNSNSLVYDSATSANFTLHNSEEGTLVNKILELAGVSINRLEVTQAAIQNEQINEADKNN